MSKTRSRNPWSQMNAKQLAEATREFDREMPGIPGRPLTAAQKKMHRDAAKAAAKKRAGRPPKGEGAEVVAVSIERGLLKRADALAKRRKVGRSALFTAALEGLMSADVPKAKAG